MPVCGKPCSRPECRWPRFCSPNGWLCLLWLPTLGLIGILTLYVPGDVSMDFGPVVAAYVGVIFIGAALLAVGLAFSTATENQVVAAVGCFSLLLAWLMAGEVDVLSGAGNLRASLQAAARGELRLDSAATMVGVVTIALAGAVALSSHGRQPVLPGWTRVGLLAIIVGSTLSLTSRHNRAWDLSAGHVNTLEPETERVLGELREPVQITVLRPDAEVFEPVYGELTILLERMREAQPLLSVSQLDALANPEKVAEWSFELAIRPEDFASGGALLVQRGARTQSIDLLAMASFAADDLGVGSLSELRAEAALRVAIADVSQQRRETLCSSTGHGELSSSQEVLTSASWAQAASRVQRDGIVLREIRRLDSELLKGCDALLILGPSVLFSAKEVLALDRFRASGGNLLIALRSHPTAGEIVARDAALAFFLEQAGMRVEDAVVVDPAGALESPPAWLTYEGYGEHAIVSDFHQRRATIWDAPWALQGTAKSVHTLVEASPSGWGERSLDLLQRSGEYTKDVEDLDVRSVALASELESGARIVLFGSAESFSSEWAARGIGGNERLLISSLHWLLRPDFDVARARVQAMSPERIRLLMTQGQLRRAFVLCVVAGPVFFGLVGAFLWWWRRREP